jgi:signal transduction histidine kinase
MTSGLTKLSEKIRSITSQNLDQRITDIENEDEIGELADSFNHLLTRLHEAFNRERQFIGDVAHELKTPLSTQQSTIEVLLSKKRTNEDYQKTLTDLLIDNKRLTDTVKDVLDLAWAEADKTQISTESTNLTELMEELYEITAQLAKSKGLEAIKRFEKNVYISGKRDKIFRALLNIVDNAIKYTPRGTISLYLTTDDGEAIVKMKDTGQGISPEDVPHIFDRFYRGSKSHRVNGTGLGLAIAHSIVSVYQGTLSVKNNEDRGTTFIATFPLSY